ncbi:hypothetical protein [Kitasatospora sp. GP82]|uniref:hypothetical protein n=1 Tax=Kitasatospora sp. GP82 TaxID=3035089 RepID=UPI002472ECA0|nr:hypothetical protein [Kitasatospora sp. GP82]MDH6129904.1 hypothetical protein [Kitasatospora sp. GP82]
MLAETIRGWLVPVFADQQSADPAEARAVFLQQLLERLSNAYAARAVLKVRAQVSADVWASAVTRWFDRIKPQDGGDLTLDLTVMSNLTRHPMPLLRLRGLYLPITQVG